MLLKIDVTTYLSCGFVFGFRCLCLRFLDLSHLDTLNDDDPDLTSTSTLLAKNGEAIYFDFETNERIETPSVTINGVSLATTDVQMQSGDNSGMRWRATYTPSVDADVSVVSFSVDGFEDPAGNIVSTSSPFTSDASPIQSMKIDATEPQLV